MTRNPRTGQPKYSAGRTRRPPRRRTRPTSPARNRRWTIIAIAVVIVALIFCWVFGRGCGGNQEAKENERLRDYTTEANKLINRSAAVGEQFDALRTGIEDFTTEDADRKLTQMVNDCKDIASDSKKIEVPNKATTLQPRLQLSFDLRTRGVEGYKTAVLAVLQEQATEETPTNMSSSLMDLVVSDYSMQSFRTDLEAKLKSANLSFEQVATSDYMPKVDDALSASVVSYIGELSGSADTGDAIHGVAVVGLSTSPARVDSTESGISILPYSESFTVKVTIENQGNQEEEDVPVVVTLDMDPEGTPQKKTQKITRLKAGETASLVFEDIKPATGSQTVNVLEVKAGPVENEKKVDNNEMQMKFIMRSEGES